MSDYHPSQQILTENEALYSLEILKSLRSMLTMVGHLDGSKSFEPDSLAEPQLSKPLNFSQKLGHLYEDALAQLLEQSPRYDLLAKNKQIIAEERQTIGELDYVLLDRKTDLEIRRFVRALRREQADRK